MSRIVQLLIFGLQLGGIYALLALGYNMVYGIVGMINFAHGDFLMVGAYAAFFLAAAIGGTSYSAGTVILIILLSMVISGLLGVITERIAYKPLRNRPRLMSLITAVAVSMFIENLFRAIPFIGPTPRAFPSFFPLQSYTFLGAEITSIQIAIIGLAALLMVILYLFIMRSPVGRQMRAISMDREASVLVGINVDKVISITFLIGASLAAASGIFYSSIYPIIDVYMGSWLGNKAFIAAVLGGIGDVRGAMLGGLIMGITEVMGTAINSDLGYGICFLILILIMLLKPAGLLGKNTVEKV